MTGRARITVWFRYRCVKIYCKFSLRIRTIAANYIVFCIDSRSKQGKCAGGMVLTTETGC
jgi:hypothetical protein